MCAPGPLGVCAQEEAARSHAAGQGFRLPQGSFHLRSSSPSAPTVLTFKIAAWQSLEAFICSMTMDASMQPNSGYKMSARTHQLGRASAALKEASTCSAIMAGPDRPDVGNQALALGV